MPITLKRVLLSLALSAFSQMVWSHYPILDCHFQNQENSTEQVKCEASFSDRSKAPGIVMEVFSEDDELLSKGHTDEQSKYQFERPDGLFFIIMDAGPGHVLEISDEEVNES